MLCEQFIPKETCPSSAVVSQIHVLFNVYSGEVFLVIYFFVGDF